MFREILVIFAQPYLYIILRAYTTVSILAGVYWSYPSRAITTRKTKYNEFGKISKLIMERVFRKGIDKPFKKKSNIEYTND